MTTARIQGPPVAIALSRFDSSSHRPPDPSHLLRVSAVFAVITTSSQIRRHSLQKFHTTNTNTIICDFWEKLSASEKYIKDLALSHRLTIW